DCDFRRLDGYLFAPIGEKQDILREEHVGARRAGLDVTLVEKAPMPLPPLDPDMAMPLVEVLRQHDVTMHLGDGLAGLDGTSAGVTRVKLESGVSIATDAVLLSNGVRPNTDLAKRAGLTIGSSGGIAVDDMQRTSDPDIYAAGDAAELTHGVTGKPSRIPLAGPANRQGRTAGEHAVCGSAAPTGRAIGTAILGLFDRAAAITGLGENAARAAGYDIDTAIVGDTLTINATGTGTIGSDVTV
ncbi:MAG TPA: FAD-dependent oxidoreductase, partial [Tepidisphaeraceae bacterium]|nr:FAD-dependent oxidoreductase [Tepidisphaeraceae bacterium]